MVRGRYAVGVVASPVSTRALVLDRWGPHAEETVRQLPSGAYVVLGDSDGLAARRIGLELRDTILVAGPSGVDAWFLFRVPATGTVAYSALVHGTGGLHIDACRIFTTWEEPDRPESWKRSGFTADPKAEKIAAPPGNGIVLHPGGRWPTNIVFVHETGCRVGGLKKMRSTSGGSGFYDRGEEADRAFNKCSTTLVTNFKDADGLETMPAWDCVRHCLVLALDEQSGCLKSGEVKAHHMRNNSKNPANGGYEGGLGDMPLMGYGDEGGASRFYPQFQEATGAHEWLQRLIGLV